MNRSSYVILELRIHREPGYLDSPNLLDEPLEIDEEVVFKREGEWYVTFIRDKRTLEHLQGELIAFTTAYLISLVSGDYTLTIFDESFRLEHSEYIPRERDGGSGGDMEEPI